MNAKELACLKEFLPIPHCLERYTVLGTVDVSENFFIETQSFHSHEISFIPRKGQDAIRVLLGKANSKIAIFEHSNKHLVA